MRKSVVFAALLISLLTAVAGAQESPERLKTAAGNLKNRTAELVDRTAGGLRRSAANARAAIEEAFLAHQLDSSAGLFQQMIVDRRSPDELRDAAAILTELGLRAPAAGSNNALWRSVKDAISNIRREIENSGRTGNGDDPGESGEDTENRPVAGKVFWRGTVDHHVQLVVRGNAIETRLLSGKSYPEGTYSFTTGLPARAMTVEVNKTKGRGEVRVVQQPEAANDFTAVIEIKDGDGGAKEYQLEIFWK